MIVYEVNLLVDRSVETQFSEWLQVHIREILAIDGFVTARWFEIESVPEVDQVKKVEWSIQYVLRDKKSLDEYFKKHAPRMRQNGIDRFGNKFSATRRVMKLKAKFAED